MNKIYFFYQKGKSSSSKSGYSRKYCFLLFLGTSGVFNTSNEGSSTEDKRYVNDPGIEFHLNEEDLFMVRYGDAGKIVCGFNGIIANNMFRLLPLIDLSKKWHYFYLDFIYDKIHALAGSSTMPAIKFGTISGLEFMNPCIEEQQKIATYLSGIDTKIKSVNTQITQT